MIGSFKECPSCGSNKQFYVETDIRTTYLFENVNEKFGWVTGNDKDSSFIRIANNSSISRGKIYSIKCATCGQDIKEERKFEEEIESVYKIEVDQFKRKSIIYLLLGAMSLFLVLTASGIFRQMLTFKFLLLIPFTVLGIYFIRQFTYNKNVANELQLKYDEHKNQITKV